MAKIKLVKGLSYRGGPKGNVITVKASKPVVEVPDEFVELFLATGYFVACGGTSPAKQDTDNPDNSDDANADTAQLLDGEIDAEALAEMNINELRAFAKEHSIKIDGLTRKADILEAISVACGGSQTIIDLQG